MQLWEPPSLKVPKTKRVNPKPEQVASVVAEELNTVLATNERRLQGKQHEGKSFIRFGLLCGFCGTCWCRKTTTVL